LAKYGSMNMYRPLNSIKASGGSGSKYTHGAGCWPIPKAMKMPMTMVVKTMDSQRCDCRIQLF
jgi:hypothetical protein